MKYLLLIFTIFTSLVNANTVKLAVENSWPPFANSNGEGISKNIITRAYATQGIDVEFVVVPYARALAMTENGEVDGAFNVTKQASTLGKFSFGHEPLLTTQASYFYASDNQLNYKTPAEIPDGTVVATIIGYEYGDEYEKHKYRFQEKRVATQEQIVKLLMSNRATIGIMFDEVASYTLRSMGLAAQSIRRGETNHVSDIYVAFNKDESKKEFIQKLDAGLKQIKH